MGDITGHRLSVKTGKWQAHSMVCKMP